MHLIIDAHEDLAYNALSFGRDYRRSAYETRRQEAGGETPARTGDTMLGWSEYQLGQVAVVFGTLFLAPARYASGAWETQVFRDAETGRRGCRAQVAYYQRLAGDSPDCFRLIRTKGDLASVLQPWQERPADPPAVTHPVGIVMLMEGAEGLGRPQELEEFVEAGLRIVGPVWAGTRFCGGMYEPGGFTSEGYELLEVMASLGLTLDIAHMNEESALEALDRYEGPVIASHANAAALLNGSRSQKRHLSDLALRRLVERDGVVGVMPLNHFLVPGWAKGDPKDRVHLDALVAHIDHICQLAGDARHVGMGSDFDGGFGWQHTPAELDTIADLQRLEPLLKERGYSNEDITAILGKNWQQHLEKTLPE